MKSLFEDYNDIVKLTEKYILQEYKCTDWIYSDRETYAYFREYARQQKVSPSTIPNALSKPVIVPLNSVKQPVSPPFIPKKTLPEPNIVKENQTHVPEPHTHIPQEEKRVPLKSPPLMLDPLPHPKPDNLTDLYQHIQEKFPAVQLVKDIPTDDKARQVNDRSLSVKSSPQVILLSYQDDQSMLTFLKNISQAIQGLGVSSALVAASSIEQAAGWEELLKQDNLKLIISNHHGLHSHPLLVRHFKEMDRHGRQYLGRIPVCLLADVSVYQKDPKLKVPLWQTIKNLLGK